MNLEGFQRHTLLEKSSSKNTSYSQLPYIKGKQVRKRKQFTNFKTKYVKKEIYYPSWKQSQTVPESLQNFGLYFKFMKKKKLGNVSANSYLIVLE